MNRLILTALLLPLLLSLTTVAQTTKEKIKQDAADTAITTKIESAYLVNKHLNPFNINTTTREGMVTLTGSVLTDSQRNLARDIAQRVEGVQFVQNNIIVIPVAFSEKERRSMKQKFRDRGTTASVRSRLLYSQRLKGFKPNVETVNDIVTLHGVVNHDAHRITAGEIAAGTRNVQQVINNILVRPRTSERGADRFGQQITDEWLETRVETAILFNRHLSIRALAVEIDDGVCVLSGNVTTQAQKDLAAQIAGEIKGIAMVENTIQVTTHQPLAAPATPPQNAPQQNTPELKEIDPVESSNTAVVQSTELDAPKE